MNHFCFFFLEQQLEVVSNLEATLTTEREKLSRMVQVGTASQLTNNMQQPEVPREFSLVQKHRVNDSTPQVECRNGLLALQRTLQGRRQGTNGYFLHIPAKNLKEPISTRRTFPSFFNFESFHPIMWVGPIYSHQ